MRRFPLALVSPLLAASCSHSNSTGSPGLGGAAAVAGSTDPDGNGGGSGNGGASSGSASGGGSSGGSTVVTDDVSLVGPVTFTHPASPNPPALYPPTDTLPAESTE